MKHMKELLFVTAVVLASELVTGQALDPAELLKPLSESWPTYSGDYSGKRYSALTQVNQSNIKNLGLVWTSRITAGLNNAGGGGRGGFANAAAPTIIGGEGTGDLNESGPNSRSSRIVSSILEVNGKLYFSTPDNAWAADARDGHILWHFVWKTKGGTHTGNRGLGMWGNRLYLVPHQRRSSWFRWIYVCV